MSSHILATITLRPTIVTLINHGVFIHFQWRQTGFKATERFKEFNDPDLKCRLYNALASYHQIRVIHPLPKIFSSAGNIKMHSLGLHNLAWVEWISVITLQLKGMQRRPRDWP
ncbi:hypothetical protein B0H13DRAFT_1935311 [Mycena leptocephala]|nr:hypothetical protein B0H13DRAFT_1935311 [Mycena leptocephala]